MTYKQRCQFRMNLPCKIPLIKKLSYDNNHITKTWKQSVAASLNHSKCQNLPIVTSIKLKHRKYQQLIENHNEILKGLT